ncbi:MAG: hypothetical protein ACR2HY_04240 [Acidimicrobiales bacterium]
MASLLGVFARTLGSGESLSRHPQVDLRRDQSRLVVRAFTTVPWQVDGDYLGRASELAFTSEPDRLPSSSPRNLLPLGDRPSIITAKPPLFPRQVSEQAIL